MAFASIPAWATTYEIEDGQPLVFGTNERYTTQYEDTFTDIARRYSLGWDEIARANPGIDQWVPGAGKDLLIPGMRILPDVPQEGIVINLPEHRLYYFPKVKKGQKRVVITYPVSIGKMDWKTPLGVTKIVSKQKNPSGIRQSRCAKSTRRMARRSCPRWSAPARTIRWVPLRCASRSRLALI
jgi:L,D-transpeptidase ErfK/SrfK